MAKESAKYMYII